MQQNLFTNVEGLNVSPAIAKLPVSRSCHLVNECHAKYTTTDAVFEDLQMALKYAAEQQRLADKCKLNVEYRVRTMPLVGHDG